MIFMSRYLLIIVSVMMMALYIPQITELALGERSLKTHLFYSPVSEKFIWRDKAENPDQTMEEKHHAQFSLMDEDGKKYTRQEFEKQLPFIYYKNMELWGLLPLKLHGQEFDKETIRRERRVIELTPTQIITNAPADEIYPLMESQPDVARLVFPEERFRIGERMEFVNADTNSVDENMSQEYTKALAQAGFVFPGRFAGGKSTILKPFDEGVFLGDAEGTIYHVKRIKGEPSVVKTPIQASSGVRYIKVSENSSKDFYGLLLSNSSELFLLTYGYNLIPIPMPGYDADRMDFKLIMNPLFLTATYSDDRVIHASVMDTDYKLIRSYEHIMSGTKPSAGRLIASNLLPFTVSLKNPDSGYLSFRFRPGAQASAMATAAAMVFYFALLYRKRRLRTALTDAFIVALTGLYGLAAVMLIPHEGD